jgi:hypothetical protein
MRDERQDRPEASSGHAAVGETARVTLALAPGERELLELALGQLLSSTRREEHMIADIRALLAKVRAAAPAA